MNEQTMPMVEDKFGLRDEEYWSDPWRNRSALQRPLMQKSQEGLVLGAPGNVALNQYRSFPVALIRVAKLTTIAKIPSRPTLIIAAVNLNTYELRARLALPDIWRPVRAAEAAGASAGRDSFSGDDSAMLSEGHTIDLATRLSLPAVRGEYLLTAILLDQVSNRCRMKLRDSAGYDDPAVDDFVREYLASRQMRPPLFPAAALPLPSYQHQEGSPPVPEQPDISLSVTRVSVFAPGARCIVKGSFRLPIQPHHVVEPVAQAAEIASVHEQAPGAAVPQAPVAGFTASVADQAVDAAAAAPGAAAAVPAPVETARIPITLLLTGSADPRPQLVKLVVPSYAPLETLDGRTLAVGHFSFDLCRHADLMITPQTHFIYAFSGEVMTPAVPAAFVRLPEEERNYAGTW